MTIDTSIFQGVVECESNGEALRFVHEGGTRWGVYTRQGGAYIRDATVTARTASASSLVDELLGALWDVREDCAGLF